MKRRLVDLVELSTRRPHGAAVAAIVTSEMAGVRILDESTAIAATFVRASIAQRRDAVEVSMRARMAEVRDIANARNRHEWPGGSRAWVTAANDGVAS